MEIKEIYRIKNGLITSSELQIPFYFGIVYDDNGYLKLELYIKENYDLNKFKDFQKSEFWNLNFTIKCLTEDNNQLKLNELRFTGLIPHLSKANMVCYGKMVHIKKDRDSSTDNETESMLYYLVIEGLRLQFNDITEVTKSRSGEKIEDFLPGKRDHTSTDLVINKFPYSHIYYKSEDSDDIIVQFTNDHSNILTYEKYLKIRNHYLAALSLLNGAQVRIKYECYGKYYSIGKVDAEKVVTYSYPTIKNTKYNEYIPINNIFYKSERVLGKFFIFCFDNFIEWNKRLELNSVIFYLNNAGQSKSLEEKVFIQIIAFERLTTMYVEYLGEKEEFIPPNEIFDPIKDELMEIIDKYKKEFNGAYSTIKSKIGNLNQIKRHSTRDKMYRILNDFNIPINSQIEDLVNVARHKTIHRGDIGKGKKGLLVSYLLDEVIREIILRMVDYKGQRISKVLLKK